MKILHHIILQFHHKSLFKKKKIHANKNYFKYGLYEHIYGLKIVNKHIKTLKMTARAKILYLQNRIVNNS